MKYKPESLAAWLILKMSETGYGINWIVAQMLASHIHSGDLTPKDIMELTDQVYEQTLKLLMDPAEIWEGLLPGGPLPADWPDIDLLENDELVEYQRAKRVVERILKLGEDPNMDDEEFTQGVTNVLRDEGFISERKPEIPVDSYTYRVSIIINPTVGHDEVSDLIADFRDFSATSVLNLAHDVK